MIHKTTFSLVQPPTMVLRLMALFGLLAMVAINGVYAQSDVEKGLKIAQMAREADRGFGNSVAELSMFIRNKQGQENMRSLRVKVLEVSGDGNKSLFIFDSPKDVKGTALLIHDHKEVESDQWLYLPALKRVKRISSSNRTGSFVGSEFAYEDLGSLEVEKYTYQWIRDEKCGSLDCTVTEFRPVEKGSGYTRQLVWHDKEAFRVWRIEYYDRKNEHLKTLANEGFEQYLGKYWRAKNSNMVNHVTGKSTELRWGEFQFQTNLNEREFTQTGLKRIR
ncbi:MAG: outer membrane lipoprotein-sorting protein [Rhodobacteraceae bacterium]|nr:outer membrane lipoprotein-sorting protein [Paracoccaceae bacterium]MCY4249333.1 outer membrane lipoprotein-sorting protein [Paracoccaceae bacterium]MCY4309092.1 outer membrane lipoprotein-sorting protein [Paracoccaceae bacterium]